MPRSRLSRWAVAASLLLLAACGRGDRPSAQTAELRDRPLAPRPPPPAWSQALAGRPFAEAFSVAGEACKGAVDGVTERLRDGVTLEGWAWDLVRRAAPAGVVLVDGQGRMTGFGDGGRPRPDVAEARPEVLSGTTGWSAHVRTPRGRLAVYGITGEGTACRIGATAPL